jgi:hypothetical protein
VPSGCHGWTHFQAAHIRNTILTVLFRGSVSCSKFQTCYDMTDSDVDISIHEEKGILAVIAIKFSLQHPSLSHHTKCNTGNYLQQRGQYTHTHTHSDVSSLVTCSICSYCILAKWKLRHKGLYNLSRYSHMCPMNRLKFRLVNFLVSLTMESKEGDVDGNCVRIRRDLVVVHVGILLQHSFTLGYLQDNYYFSIYQQVLYCHV